MAPSARWVQYDAAARQLDAQWDGLGPYVKQQWETWSVYWPWLGWCPFRDDYSDPVGRQTTGKEVRRAVNLARMQQGLAFTEDPAFPGLHPGEAYSQIFPVPGESPWPPMMCVVNFIWQSAPPWPTGNHFCTFYVHARGGFKFGGGLTLPAGVDIPVDQWLAATGAVAPNRTLLVGNTIAEVGLSPFYVQVRKVNNYRVAV